MQEREARAKLRREMHDLDQRITRAGPTNRLPCDGCVLARPRVTSRVTKHSLRRFCTVCCAASGQALCAVDQDSIADARDNTLEKLIKRSNDQTKQSAHPLARSVPHALRA